MDPTKLTPVNLLVSSSISATPKKSSVSRADSNVTLSTKTIRPIHTTTVVQPKTTATNSKRAPAAFLRNTLKSSHLPSTTQRSHPELTPKMVGPSLLTLTSSSSQRAPKSMPSHHSRLTSISSTPPAMSFFLSLPPRSRSMPVAKLRSDLTATFHSL